MIWQELSGWEQDAHADAFATFLASCRPVVNRKPTARDTRPMHAALAAVCRDALVLGPATAEEAREFFEARFRPVRIARLGDREGFLTGYYEPVVAGSRVQTPEFSTPMYRRPPDLVVPGRHRPGGAKTMPNKGPAYRRVGKKLVAYFDRAEIENGALAGKGLEICWLRDPIDRFFIQIQGSSRIRLEDGTTLRLNYDGHNGQPYTPVGAVLIQEGAVERADMSMDKIREWMIVNPDRAEALRHKNRSFVFFRIAELADDQEAVGGQGIPLTANRSIAVDRKLHTYGTPLWIDGDLPIRDVGATEPFRRLMIAQDTGSAIVGPARGDLYFGAGDEAGRVAGRIKHPASFVMLVPRSLDPAATAGAVPYPQPRPQP